MATLEDLYSKYFPGQDPPGTYDAYNMSYSGGLTPSALAYQAAQAGDVEGWLTASRQTQVYGQDPITGEGRLQPIGDAFNPLGFYAQQGREPVVRNSLQAIAQAAGVPDYDWTPAINKAAMQLAAEFGGQSPTSETRLPELIRRIAASAPDQQIQQTYQQIAPQINPVLEDQYTQLWNQSKDYKSDKFRGQVLKAASVAALPIGGYYATGGAPAAGAADLGGVTGAAGELGAGGAIGSYGSQLAASGAGVGGAAATGADASWGVNEIQQGTTAETGGSLPPLADTAGSGVTVGTAAGGNAAGPTILGTATGGGPFVGAGGAMLPAMGDALAGGSTNGTFTPPAQQGAYQFPWQNVLGAVLGYLGQNEAGKTSEDLMRQMIESDQWRTQQPRYFEPIYEAATKGIGDTAYGQSIAEQTARQSAASGYNMSGNMLTDIAKSLNSGTMDYVKTLTPLATGRGESNAYSAFGPSISKSAEAPYGMIGYGLGEIFKGQQPNNGTQNQTLIDLFR